MSRFKRTFILALASLMVFASCASTPNDPGSDLPVDGGTVQNGDVPAEPAETEASDPAGFVLEGVRFDGQAVRFLIASPYNEFSSEISPLEEDYQPGEIIPEAVVERNNLVYEKIGVEIEAVPTSGRGTNWESFPSDLAKSVSAGAKDYDAICASPYGAYKSAAQQLIVNLEAVDTLDLSHPWWSQRSRKSLDFGSDSPIVYYINGDINYFDNWGTSCVFFNKNFLADCGYEMPYDLVREYKWTYDAMTSMSESMYRDLDGNGQKSFDDAYGIVANTGIMERFLPAMGFDLVTRNDEDEYVINETEAFVNITETIYNYLLSDPNVWLDGGAYSEIFYRGDAAFSEDNLYAIRRSSGEMEADYGVLPYPMWEESGQEYGCTVSEAYATVCGITLTADREAIGLVLDVMGAYSPATVTNAVIDNGAMIRNARDEDTADMIRIIMDSAEFSLALITEWGVRTYFNGALQSGSGFNYASSAARMGKIVKKSAEKDLANLRA